MIESRDTGRETAPEELPVGREQLQKWMRILQKYKAGKASLERRVVAAENWWKLRNTREERKESYDNPDDFHRRSGWLHNVIVSKHADAMEAYPEPNVLPREPEDRQEATILSSIIPCILEQNKFENTYSDAMWQKLKTGTAAYMVTWDAAKQNGLGDICIERVSLLNLFWEPGVEDIQDSRYVFYTYLEDKDELESRYPQLKGRMKGDSFAATKFLYDDAVDTSDKATVVQVYYHRWEGTRRVLHFCQFVGDTVLYSTENRAGGMAGAGAAPGMTGAGAGLGMTGVGETDSHGPAALGMTGAGEGPGVTEGSAGLYAHGRYPFVLDPLFPVEGSPCGYGFIDLGSNAQTAIDLMGTAFLKNTMVGATPRYMAREGCGVNEEEFADLRRPIVHVSGTLDEAMIRPIQYNALGANYISVLESTINELRQVTGNTETATGSTAAGATAASAIAALQEASGKGSRDSSKSSYRAYGQIVEMVIELIRQFMSLPRVFRIAGEGAAERFVSYSNQGLGPQWQGELGGRDLGYRVPLFDVKIEPQKRSAYTRLSQNEMALQFYGAGFFQPENAEQALTTLGMMEFEGKEELLQKIESNADTAQKLAMFQQLALALANKYEPERVPELAQAITGQAAQPPGGGQSVPEADFEPEQEPTHMQRARERAAAAGQPT